MGTMSASVWGPFPDNGMNSRRGCADTISLEYSYANKKGITKILSGGQWVGTYVAFVCVEKFHIGAAQSRYDGSTDSRLFASELLAFEEVFTR